jgi:hypothetical protein
MVDTPPLTIADELRAILAEGRTAELLGQWLSLNASRILNALPEIDVEDCAQAVFDADDSWLGYDDHDERIALAVIRMVRPDFPAPPSP